MTSNTDVVKKTILSVLCLYLCVCMSVANIGPYRLYQNQIFKIPVTFYNARCRCSVLLWSHCNMSCTSGFVDDVMFSRNDKVIKTSSPCQLYTLARYMLSSCVCPSVSLSQAGVVSKRVNGSSWFLYRDRSTVL